MDKKLFSLDHLSPTEFENFCFDLLIELGFSNLNWRKGTGLTSSPSDQGRDIEALLVQHGVDESVYTEKWFVECKHYIQGVPPEKLQSILTWANSERPHNVLIIVSNFLSNGAKTYIENYIKSNTPPFRINVWERPKLEELACSKSKLLRKYNILGEFPHLGVLHPAHAAYLKSSNRNTLRYFFTLLDHYDRKGIDAFLMAVASDVIKPRYREPKRQDETIKELMVDPISYSIFKQRCIELSKIVTEHFLISGIVNRLLQYLLRSADPFTIDQEIEFDKSMIRAISTPNPSVPIDKDSVKKGIAMYQMFIDTAPTRQKETYDTYQNFCEEIVSKLLNEELQWPTLSEMEAKIKELDNLP